MRGVKVSSSHVVGVASVHRLLESPHALELVKEVQGMSSSNHRPITEDACTVFG
jgi:hypothetical protein